MNDEIKNADDRFTPSDPKVECLEKLRRAKVRMSRQRLELLDLLFEGSYRCAKEFYFVAHSRNPRLGMSTVYRFLRVLYDAGVIANSRMIDVSCAGCTFKALTAGDDGGREFIADGIGFRELLRLGMVVKGLIGSDEKIDVKMAGDSVRISVRDKS